MNVCKCAHLQNVLLRDTNVDLRVVLEENSSLLGFIIRAVYPVCFSKSQNMLQLLLVLDEILGIKRSSYNSVSGGIGMPVFLNQIAGPVDLLQLKYTL